VKPADAALRTAPDAEDRSMRLYIAFRLVSYAAGLAGMILLVQGRRGADPQGRMAAVGMVLLLVSFAAFIATYIFYTFDQITRRKR
jgi:hypothetical protein